MPQSYVTVHVGRSFLFPENVIDQYSVQLAYMFTSFMGIKNHTGFGAALLYDAPEHCKQYFTQTVNTEEQSLQDLSNVSLTFILTRRKYVRFVKGGKGNRDKYQRCAHVLCEDFAFSADSKTRKQGLLLCVFSRRTATDIVSLCLSIMVWWLCGDPTLSIIYAQIRANTCKWPGKQHEYPFESGC